jgi:hypothetical protein
MWTSSRRGTRTARRGWRASRRPAAARRAISASTRWSRTAAPTTSPSSVEAWRDEAALLAHAGAAHTRAVREALLPIRGRLFDERLCRRVE